MLKELFMRRVLFACGILLLSASFVQAQVAKKDTGHFVKSEGSFWKQIKTSLDSAEAKPKEEKTKFKVDLSGYDLPQSPDEFTQYWHNPPISQGRTGTCWSFSTTSFLESEVHRLTGQDVKLSEMYTAYWEYVEKARRYVQERGDSEFGEGSEADAVTRIWKKYGIVPESAYPEKPADLPYPDHKAMYDEMHTYLKSLKKSNAWNEDQVISTIKSIMNHYIDAPPTEVTVKGKEYTPREYLSKVLKLNPDDYVAILSLKEKPYWEQVEYEVPDNWWHSDQYYNVPLDVYMDAINSAIRNGYTMSIGGDVSEAGMVSEKDVAIVPSFDIPSQFIDEDARQFRFSNKTTTDDHGIHLIGYLDKDGTIWYLIKDSGSGSRNGKNAGYYFYREDYVKLKMVDFMVHKDAVKDILKKF